MKKLLIGCAVTAMLMFSTVSTAKAGNNDWIAPLIGGMVFGVIISNSGGGHGHVRRNPHRRHGGYHYRQRSRYVEQCLTVPHRYVDHYGNYHDYSRVECRMIRRNPHLH